MVAKASRCQTCRFRKVRCDQQWPQCGPCQRGKRKCPGPPSVAKFVFYNGSQRTSKTLAAKAIFDDDEAVPANQGHNVEEEYTTNHTPALSSTIDFTPASRVAAALIARMQVDTAIHNPSHLGTFVQEIPPMLETSSALTATMRCCLDACNKKERLETQHMRLDARLYGKALGEVQRALTHPEQRTSITTLLAIMLLQKLETVLSTRQLASIPCWSIHAGGISQLLQCRGVLDPDDDIIFNAVLESFGPIVSHSVFRNEECFLTSPEWQSIFQDRKSATKIDRMLYVIHSQLAFLPRLLSCYRALRNGEDAFSSTMDVALQMSAKLSVVGHTLETILPELPRTRVLDDPIAPISAAYEVANIDISRLVCWHSVLSILVNHILVELAQIDDNEQAAAVLREHNLVSSKRVWMLSREAQAAGVLRYYFYPGALVTTWESAESDSARQWIVNQLNRMQGCGCVSEDIWTAETAQRASDTLQGKR